MVKREALILKLLREQWDVLTPEDRREKLCSLMGYRIPFRRVAKLIGREEWEVHTAYKTPSLIDKHFIDNCPTRDAEQPAQVVASPAPVLIVDEGADAVHVDAEPGASKPAVTFDSLPDDCGFSGLYAGTQPPRCAGGVGCKKCWARYSARLEEAVTPGKKKGDPFKAIYELPFDEGLRRYKEWMGWVDYKLPEIPPIVHENEIHGLVISDLHTPFHDEKKFRRLVEDTKGKVDVCILAGDGPDFFNFSRYTKFGQHFTAVEELRAFQMVLAILSESYPEVVVMEGNHDERVRKALLRMGMPPDHVQFMLELYGHEWFSPVMKMCAPYANVVMPTPPKHGYAQYPFLYQVGDLIIGHPELYSRIPNKSVGGFIDWIMKKAVPMGIATPPRVVISGHTHQAGKTWNDYGVVGIENGCICMTPDYDGDPKLCGAPRPLVQGYSLFVQDRATGKTDVNRTNFYQL